MVGLLGFGRELGRGSIKKVGEEVCGWIYKVLRGKFLYYI